MRNSKPAHTEEPNPPLLAELRARYADRLGPLEISFETDPEECWRFRLDADGPVVEIREGGDDSPYDIYFEELPIHFWLFDAYGAPLADDFMPANAEEVARFVEACASARLVEVRWSVGALQGCRLDDGFGATLISDQDPRMGSRWRRHLTSRSPLKEQRWLLCGPQTGLEGQPHGGSTPRDQPPGPDTPQTWVGVARRWRVLRRAVPWALVGIAVLALGILLRQSPEHISIIMVWVPMAYWAMALIELVSGWRTVRPVTLTVDARTVTLTRGDVRVEAALADVTWPDVQLDDEVVLVTRPTDGQPRPRVAVAIDLLSFARAHRNEIVDVLHRALGRTP